MAIIQSNWAKGRLPTPVPNTAGDVVSEIFEVALTGPLAANDIVEIGVLPAYATIVDAYLDTDDLDSGTTLVADIGIMSGEVGKADVARTVGNELFAATTALQAAGLVRLNKGVRIASTDADRSIGIKATAGAAGGGIGKVRLAVFYKQ